MPLCFRRRNLLPRHPMARLLLIQIREADGFSARHEQGCMRRCIPDVDWVVRSALGDALPAATWLDGVDGFVIGGSGNLSLVEDEPNHPWVPGLRHLLDEAMTRTLPGLCICFGHQLLGLHLGADVVTDRTRGEAGTITVERVAEDALLAGPDPFFVHTGHSDHVMAVPTGTTLLARTERSEVQALRVNGTHLYSTQFHPDLTAGEAVERYHQAFGHGPEATAAAARFDGNKDHHTEALLARWWAARPQ